MTNLKARKAAKLFIKKRLKIDIRYFQTELNKYKRLFENANDIIYTLDRKGRFLDINKKGEEVTGYRVKDWIGRPYDKLLVKEFLPEAKRTFLNSLRGITSKPNRFAIKSKKGEIIWLEIKSGPLRDDKGRITGEQSVARDITEIKRIEETLLSSERRYRSLFENSSDLIFFMDKNGVFTDCNRRAEEILNFKKSRIVGRHFTYRIAREHRLKALGNFRKGLIGKRIQPYAIKIIDGQNKEKFIEIRSSNILDGRRTIGRFAVARDITEEKKSTEELRTIKAQQEAILNNIPDIAWLKDKESRFIAVNETFANTLNLKPGDVVGKNDLDFYPKKLAQMYRADDREVMRTGRRKIVDEPYVDANGNQTWIETIKTPVLNDRNQVVGTAGIARDITERIRAEDAMRESEEKYRTLFEKSAEGILLADTKTRYILYANPTVCTMLGYSEEELTKLKVDDIHPPWVLNRVLKEFSRQVRGLKTLAQDIPFLQKSGKTLLADINAAIVKIKGRKALLGFVNDITDKKKFEEERLKLSRLAAIGTFSASIAHEIRNPLFSISTIAQLMQEELQSSPNRDLFCAMTSEINRLKDFINDMLFYSRPQKTIRRKISLLKIACNIHKTNVPLLKDKKLSFKIVTKGPKNKKLSADPSQIKRLILNLFYNAVEASNKGGLITFKINHSPAQKSGRVEFSIHNKGRHIKRSELPSIFDLFHSTKAKGCGFGLGICRKIVEAHDGAITVASTGRKGTIFTVQL